MIGQTNIEWLFSIGDILCEIDSFKKSLLISINLKSNLKIILITLSIAAGKETPNNTRIRVMHTFN